MSKFRLYLRMGARGVLRNRQLYLPFLLAAAGCVAMCYILRFLAYSDLVATMRGGVYAVLMLNLGSCILVFLVVWILVYANGFVMHRRARELALYSVLGLRRRDAGGVRAVLCGGVRPDRPAVLPHRAHVSGAAFYKVWGRVFRC